MQFAISGEKKMIDIYQWLINSVSKVNLQQQQRLFYNVISWVNDIIEFPWLFIFLVLKISNLFWKLGGNELAGSLSRNFQLATKLVCDRIFASDSVSVCFMLYQALMFKTKKQTNKKILYSNWESCLCSAEGKMSSGASFWSKCPWKELWVSVKPSWWEIAAEKWLHGCHTLTIWWWIPTCVKGTTILLYYISFHTLNGFRKQAPLPLLLCAEVPGPEEIFGPWRLVSRGTGMFLPGPQTDKSNTARKLLWLYWACKTGHVAKGSLSTCRFPTWYLGICSSWAFVEGSLQSDHGTFPESNPLAMAVRHKYNQHLEMSILTCISSSIPEWAVLN